MFDALGYVITRAAFLYEPKHQKESITLFVSTTSAVALFSVIYFLQYTTQLLLIAFLTYGILKNFKHLKNNGKERLPLRP